MDERWMQLTKFECPAPECLSDGRRFDWVCSKDRTNIYVSNYAYIRCDSKKPGGGWYHYGQIVEARWNCGRHSNHECNGFTKGDVQGFTYSLLTASMKFNMTRWGRHFTRDLMDNIGKQYGIPP